MINFIKQDFIKCRAALNYVLKKNVPFGIFLIYYVVLGVLLLPMFPVAYVYYKVQLNRIKKWEKELMED